MDQKLNERLIHVFEESFCCLCGRYGEDVCLKIADNFIKHNNKLYSFHDVIKNLLFQVYLNLLTFLIYFIITSRWQEIRARLRYASNAK